MIYRTIEKNDKSAYVVGAFVINKNDKYSGAFWFNFVYYGYTKQYALKLYNKTLKDRGYIYDRY
jgi:hypothetical protein